MTSLEFASLPSQVSRTSAWNFAAIAVRAAAGRAWMPAALRTRTSASAAGSVLGAGGMSLPDKDLSTSMTSPTWSRFEARAPSARAQTSSRVSPPDAETAATTSPSTKGAATTRASVSGTSSQANCAFMTADPRSVMTMTPSPLSTEEMADAIAVASVPRLPSGRPAAHSMAGGHERTICIASSTAARASTAEWETATIPTRGAILGTRLRERPHQQSRRGGTRVDMSDAPVSEIAGASLERLEGSGGIASGCCSLCRAGGCRGD